MAIKITQIKPEGAQKSAPSAKDYSGEKKGSSGSAVSGSSGRIQITKIPGAEKQRSIAASRKTTRETEHADELDKQTTPSASRQASKQTFGQRVLKGIESGLVSEGANLANLGGVATDRRGGTEMSGVYRRQAETLDKQIAALEKTLKDPTMTVQDIKETNEALAIARSEREKYGKVIESGEKTASSLYDTADKGYSFAQKLSEESTAGTKGIKKGALSIVPAATQIGLQTAERMVAPGMDVAGRALSVAGGNAADYRRKAGEQYDAEKATLRATVSALGVAAGGALSKGVNAAGLKLLRTAGKQNYVLPNIALGGASAVGYAAGETGASELSKAMTDEDYAPDWKAIGETALTAFAFGAISSAINAAAITGRNKKYMNELNDAAKERYDYAKRIIEDPRATAEQKAAGAQSVMDAMDKMRYTLDDLQVVGAQKEVDAMREFLLSIYGEMIPYTNVSAGGIGTGASGLAPVAPVGGSIAPVQTGGGMSAMQENAPTAPISPRAPGAAAVMQNTEPAPAPTVGQQNTMPTQPAVTPESAQGMGEGNLTPTQPNAAQGAAEGKADALDAGKRVNLLEYSNEQNAQKVENGLKDGTLAVDAKENIYRVNEDQHIDRRDSASVGERSVNAFQFDHPELHSYYADAAAVLQEEMSFAQKGGELIRRTNREAGDDEYIRTKRGVSERIARLMDDEGVRYDDIDRSLDAIIHNHGQENFAAAKRVELLLDDMLANGYTDIHGQHIAPNEEYIAAKKAIPGADMSERTHEELPIYDMPEGRNGGIDNAGQETQNDAAGAELADAGERGGVSERSGRRDAGARTGEQSGRLGRGGSQRAAEQSGAAIERQNLARNLRLEPVSSTELGVRAGTDTKSVTVLPESAWDAKLQETAQRIQYETSKTPVFVLGSIPVRGRDRVMSVRGVWAGGQIIVQADHMSVSPEQIASHEIFHEYADQNPGLIQAVERSIREKYSDKEFDGIVESYIRNLRGIIDIDENAADYEVEQALLDVKNEILADAYAGINAFGEKAGKYQEDVQQTLEERGIVDTGHETAAATERRTGPPEKYSIANTRDMPWKDQVRGYFSNDGTIKSSDSLYLGESSVEGVDNAPMYIPMSVITKAIRPPKGSRSAHALSQKNILNLQEGIKNAPVVIDNPARNSIVYVTADQDSAGNYIIAALDKSNDLYGETAHKVTSIHGRENIAAMLEKLGNDATIFVKNENKLNRMLPGNQILKSLALRAKVELDDNSVSGHGENVKSPTLGDEIRRQIMGEETEPFKTGESSAKDVDTGGATSSTESVSENGGNVKPKTRFSLEDETDSAGRELTMQQREYFKDSEVRDEDGRLIPVYHGSQTQFTEFSADFMSMHGSMEGQGFYFTDNRSMAEGYKRDGGQLLEGYLNISKPLSDSEVTMTKAELKKLLKAVDPTGDDVVINYDPTGGMGYPSKAWYNRALAATVEQIYSTSDSDSEILADVANSGAGAGATTKAARRALGYDGYIVKGKYDDATVYVAFESNQFKNADNKTPTENQDIRFSAEDEDGGEWDKELARMPQSVQEAVRRVKDERSKKPSMQEFPNLDAYLSGRSAQQAAEKAERLRDKGKDEFKGTEALEKLGVKIENSAGDYSNVEQLIANDRAAKTIQRETRKAIKRLGATPKEQNFALNIASGLYDEADIPATMNRGKVVELADYYSAEQSMSTDFIRQRRAEINDRLQEKMKDLFDEHFDGEFTKEKSGKGISPESGFALYHRTPQRSMRAIFGWKRGEKINEAIFEPVYVNEQERKRFVNRMHDEVRTFKGEDGKEEALTQRERALAQLSIEGKAVEEMVGKSEIKQQIIHAAENLLDGAEMKDTAQEFGLHGKEERELAQRYADWLETKRELDSGEVDRVRVENAAAKYSGLYNEFYAAINDFLVAHGYEPIGFIKGYAPHFQPEAESGKLERALKAIGVDLGAEVGKLPASIAGLTKEFKPNKRYNPFFQHRNGKSTDYDIQKGFEKYVDYLSDVLYHTDDIMRTRAASKYFRKKYAPDEISAQIQQAEDLKFATAEEKELFLKTNGIIDSSAKMSYQAMNQAMEKYTDSLFDDVTQTTKYGDLVTWLDDYANKLAGKQLFNDRSMEREVGRMSLNVGRKLVSTFARANVAGNLSSALNQTAQLPMIAGELGPKYVAEAIGDIASGKAKGDFADRSDFLTEKRGIRYLTSTKGDKFTAALFWPLERMDYLVSSIAVRGKYRKELAEGKSEKDALRAADRWGRDMMGSRSKGTAPLTFQSKNLISQMVNLFQVEALNSWEHVTQDLFGPGLREMEEKLGKKEASRRLAGIIVGTLLGAFMLNRVDEELYGGTPAQFDVLGLLTGFLASGNGLSTNEQLGVWVDDVWQKMTGERLFGTDEDAGNDEFNLAAAAEDTIYNVSNDVPYVRNVSGLLGLGDQTLPMPDIYGTAKGIGSAVSDAASGDTEGFGSEIMRQLMGIAGDTLPGGRQLEKTAQGAETLARGGTYKGSGDNERLQYAVNPDFSTVLQAMLFGRNALSEARDFYAANDGGLSASQTRTYQELVDMGADREVVYDAIQKWRKIDKDDSLTDGEREAAQFELVRKLKLTNEQKERMHDDLSRSSRSYAAAQEAQKQGISAETYAKYKDTTADLTADKDENGKTINGSKKAKVLDAIDKMQLNKKQKDWLYRDAGYSEKDIGKAPWNS